MVGNSNPSIYASSWQTKSGESLTPPQKKEREAGNLLFREKDTSPTDPTWGKEKSS